MSIFWLAAEVGKFCNRFSGFWTWFESFFQSTLHFYSLYTLFSSTTWLLWTLQFAHCGIIKAHLSESAALLSLCRVIRWKNRREKQEFLWMYMKRDVKRFADCLLMPLPNTGAVQTFPVWTLSGVMKDSHFNAAQTDHSMWNKHQRERPNIHMHQKRAEMSHSSAR